MSADDIISNSNIIADPNIIGSADVRDAVEGDTILRSAESLSGFTMQIKNAGVGVARHVDIRSRGY